MDKELLIQHYFSNQLTDEQRRLFKQLLASDADFKEQFEFEKNLQGAIRNKQNIDLKSKLIGFEKEITEDIPAKQIRPSYRKWAMAASIAVMATLGWLGYTNLSGPNFDALYDTNFQEYPNTAYTITRGDNQESIERDAFVAYESGNYEIAVEKMQQIPLSQKEEYVDFYLAQSHMHLGNHARAKDLFGKIIKGNAKFAAESYWYAALVSLKEGDKQTAIEQLRILLDSYDYQKEKATTLLKELQ